MYVFKLLLIPLILLISLLYFNSFCSLEAADQSIRLPIVNSNHFRVERIFSGINDSTSMAFVGPNDILILERESGKVDRILNGQMLDKPLIDVNAHYKDGLLGIATSEGNNGSLFVFLFFNEAPREYGMDVDNIQEADMVNRTIGYDREGDRLYRFEMVGDKLINPKLLFSIPATKPAKILDDMHHGGEVIVGPDKAVYFVIGDLDGKYYEGGITKAQNHYNSREPDGRAGILKLSLNGKPIGKGILGHNYPLNLYYAYGIRNSFGMDFDPVTGNLWDTENGPDYGDEINLVKPGFNSGGDIVQGMSAGSDSLKDLVNFNGKGKYSDPQFVWTTPVGPTAIKFFDSNKFGENYQNDIFVADVNNGNIYHFDLNKDRTRLVLNGSLQDKVADTPGELESIIFAKGFGGITDMEIGPDGYLYILSYQDFLKDKYLGTLHRIVPTN